MFGWGPSRIKDDPDGDHFHLLERVKPADQEQETGRRGDGTTSNVRDSHSATSRPLGLKKTWLAIMMASLLALVMAVSLLVFLWAESHRNIAGQPMTRLWQTLRDPGRLFGNPHHLRPSHPHCRHRPDRHPDRHSRLEPSPPLRSPAGKGPWSSHDAGHALFRRG